MFEIRTTSLFEKWLTSLDRIARGRIIARLEKAAFGLFGDVKPVGGVISEMREHFGPGYRLYFVKHGKVILIMLAGGDKASQSKDIAQAKLMASKLR